MAIKSRGRTRSSSKDRVLLGTCSLKLGVPRVIGIVNNTPDSFSGDGLSGSVSQAIAQAEHMFVTGADVVDVGGESTRPGASPVDVEDEISRVIPIIEELAKTHPGRISVDTMKPEVAEAALFAGASVVNDVSGLRNPKMMETVAEHDASVIIMHMKGEPRTMQLSPKYKDVVREVRAYLHEKVGEAERAGINPRKIIVDPGIGFGKTVDHNLEILARLKELKSLGKPVVIGASRKAFIGKVSGAPPGERLPGSLAVAVLAAREGADFLRVHDVAETVQALALGQAILAHRR